MSFKHLFLALFCVVFFSLSARAGENKQSPWCTFIQKYGGSLAIGTVIGTISGTTTRLMDEMIPFPINWPLWYEIRWQAIESCEKTMREAHIEHDAAVIENSAWASAWLSYLIAHRHRGFHHMGDGFIICVHD